MIAYPDAPLRPQLMRPASLRSAYESAGRRLAPTFSPLLLQHQQQFGLVAGAQSALAERRIRRSARGDAPVAMRLPGLPHPVYLRPGTTDLQVFHQVFMEVELRVTFPRPPQFIIDAGANIGLATLSLLRAFPEARVVALEIESSNFALLKRNLAPYPNALPLKAALWHESTRLDFHDPGEGEWGFRVQSTADDDAGAAPALADRHTVPAVGVRDVLDAFDVPQADLVKIDIEGAELEVFRYGTEGWIDRVGVLAVELHDRFRPGCRTALDAAVGTRQRRWDRSGEFTIVQQV